MAERARDELKLDRVLFIPAWRSPFKNGMETPDAALRLEMTALAVGDNPAFGVEPFEAEKPRISWTIDTVRHLKSASPNDRFTMVLGADAFQDMPLWKEPDEILSSVRVAVAGRPGSGLDMASHPYADSARIIEMPMLDISSSDIRRRVAEGRSIRYLVPWTVHTFIYSRNLYAASTRP